MGKETVKLEFTQSEYDTAKERIERRLVDIKGKKLFPLKKDAYVEYTERLIYETIYGEQIADEFLKNLGGLPELIEYCQEQSKEKGTITAIDGRELNSRSPHSALNLLLQGSAGIIAKQWMVNYYDMAKANGLKHGRDFVQQAFIHDEYDCRCIKEHTKTLARCLEEGAAKVTQDFNTNIPIKADSMIGLDWNECH